MKTEDISGVWIPHFLYSDSLGPKSSQNIFVTMSSTPMSTFLLLLPLLDPGLGATGPVFASHSLHPSYRPGNYTNVGIPKESPSVRNAFNVMDNQINQVVSKNK